MISNYVPCICDVEHTPIQTLRVPRKAPETFCQNLNWDTNSARALLQSVFPSSFGASKMINSGRSHGVSERAASKKTNTTTRTFMNRAFEADEFNNDSLSESSGGIFSPTVDDILSPPTTDNNSASARQVATNRLSGLESQLALMRTTVEGFPAYVAQLQAIEEEFDGLRHLQSVPGQLEEVACRLVEAERFLRADQTALLAVTEKVETMGLALEVVEQSLEYFEETDETIENLRSRMDDFDVGMENSELRVDELERKMDRLQAKVEEAHCLVHSASADVSYLNSGASTPSSITERSSSARVKAAVHTLSDGYRSLHKAMNLMYDEQTDVASRVARVGVEIQGMPTGGQSRLSKIRADKGAPGVASFRLVDFDDAEEDTYDVDEAGVDTVLLSQVNAVELSRNDRRVAALEAEVKYLKEMLSKLAVGLVEEKGEENDDDDNDDDSDNDQPAEAELCPVVKVRLAVSSKGVSVSLL